MEAHVAVCVAVDEADGQAPAQLATGRFVADAAVETCAQRMQLRLGHGPLQSENQAIIKQRGVIHPIAVADQRVGDAAQIQEPVPIRVAPREPGDVEAEDNAHVA